MWKTIVDDNFEKEIKEDIFQIKPEKLWKS